MSHRLVAPRRRWRRAVPIVATVAILAGVGGCGGSGDTTIEQDDPPFPVQPAPEESDDGSK